MEVEHIETDNGINITFDTCHGDEFWFMVSSLSKEQSAMLTLNIHLCLDRAIELRGRLTEIINSGVAKINRKLDSENPEQVATELAGVIDWSFKEAK